MKKINILLTTLLIINTVSALNKATPGVKSQGHKIINNSYGYGYQYQSNNTSNFNAAYIVDVPQPPPPQAGVGYSTDMGMMANKQCYNYDSSKRGEQHADLKIDSGLSTEELADSLGISLGASGGYDGLSVSDTVSYLRDRQDTDKTYTLNYYYKVYYDRTVSYPLAASLLLTQVGQDEYANGTNPDFRRSCGDILIGSWEEGAAVIASVRLKFNSSADKTTFKNEFSAGYGDMASVSSTVSKIASSKKISATMELTAHQIGGATSAIGGVLSGPSVVCNATETNTCDISLNAISKYMAEDFPTQFTDEDDEFWDGVLVPLGKFSPVANVGRFLHLSPSVLTDDIVKKRNTLETIFRKNIIYYEGAYDIVNSPEFYNSLPQEWKTHFTNLLNNSKHNVELLKMTIGPNEDMVTDCWYKPSACPAIYDAVFPKIIKTNYADTDVDGKPSPIENTGYWFAAMNHERIEPLSQASCPSGTVLYDGSVCKYEQASSFMKTGPYCPAGTSYSLGDGKCVIFNADNVDRYDGMVNYDYGVEDSNVVIKLWSTWLTPSNMCPVGSRFVRVDLGTDGKYVKATAICKTDATLDKFTLQDWDPVARRITVTKKDDVKLWSTDSNNAHLLQYKGFDGSCFNNWQATSNHGCDSGLAVGINDPFGFYIRDDAPYFYERSTL